VLVALFASLAVGSAAHDIGKLGQQPVFNCIAAKS